jgi:hypothetical protein
MSTLQVENLIGPTSGSNANKVIIPSGQTLDASNGFVAPAGHVVQTKTFETTTSLISTSTSYQDILTLNFTPLYNNSVLLVAGVVLGVAYQGTAQFNGSKWQSAVTPSGSSSTTHKVLEYMWHVPTGEYYGGSVPFNFKYTVSSTVSHEVKIQAFSRNGSNNALRSRNNETSFISIQEIAQ